MQIVFANPRGFHAGVELTRHAVGRARDDFGAPESIVLTLPREPERRAKLAAGTHPVVVAAAVSVPATGAVA
jgi:hypothetical protein